VIAGKLPRIFLMHPVGEGATRSMNVLSAKLWVRALVDLLPNIVICAGWLTYAEAMVARERGLRDALIEAETCYGGAAVGGEFTRGTIDEWNLFGRLGRAQIDLTKRPMPGLLTYETFGETRTEGFRRAVTEAFERVTLRAAA